MGKNRDKPQRDVKKPKKKDLHEAKPLSVGTLSAPTATPELVRRKRRPASEEDFT